MRHPFITLHTCFGFFSIFNNDAIKDVKIYKGDIPASAGGRLASLLDVRMKEGNNREFAGTGGIGNISSRLTLEGPLFAGKGSFSLAAGVPMQIFFFRWRGIPRFATIPCTSTISMVRSTTR
jgi:hypothetical protein